MDNIVIVVPSTPTYGKAPKVYQYNYGQILRIQGLNLPKVAEVHFSYNETYGDSVTRIANTKDGVTDVLIPDSFLENNDSKTDYTVYAYIYLEDGTSGETVCKIDIPVKARSKPEVPGTPEEPELFRETVKAVNDAADRAEQALGDVEEIRDNLNLDLSEKITRPDTAKVGQVLAVKGIDESGKPTVFEAEDVKVPTKTSELENDSGFLTEHQDISGKLDKDKLPEAIDDALEQAKESGEFNGKDGAPGEKGDPGPKGDPGETTYIENPYDDTKIKKEIAAKVGYSEVVGNQLLMYADDTKEKLLATLELPRGVEDVKVGGKSIVGDGSVAEIPMATIMPGLVKVSPSFGVGNVNSSKDGYLCLWETSKANINARVNKYQPLTATTLDYAVKAAMCDGKGAAWTTDEQAAARERMGIGECELIADVTLEEDVNSYEIQTQYGYKQIKVFLDNVEDGKNGSFYSYGIVKRVNGNYQGAITITYGDLSTRYRYGYIGMECINENVIAVTESSVKSSRDAIYGIYNFPCFKQSWYCSDKLYGIAFTPVKEADILKTGTKIQVYGVSA